MIGNKSFGENVNEGKEGNIWILFPAYLKCVIVVLDQKGEAV